MVKKKADQTESPIRKSDMNVDRFTLRAIQLVRCEAENTIIDGRLPERLDIGARCSARRADDESRIKVDIEFTIKTSLNDSGAGKESPLTLLAAYRLVYESDSSFSVGEDDLRDFVFSISAPDAWPYFCDLVQSTMTRMGLPQMPIPCSFKDEVFRLGSIAVL